MYRHILVAPDGSLETEQVLPHVEALAGQFNSDVLLIDRVTSAERLIAAGIEPGTGLVADPDPLIEAQEAEEQDALSYLESSPPVSTGRAIRTTIDVPEANASTAIVERPRVHGMDLIAMTTDGRSGLSRLVWGSRAELVLHRAPCPALPARVKNGR